MGPDVRISTAEALVAHHGRGRTRLPIRPARSTVGPRGRNVTGEPSTPVMGHDSASWIAPSLRPPQGSGWATAAGVAGPPNNLC